MSGSPVIRRSWGFHNLQRDQSLGGIPRATRFVGVYAGRVGPDESGVQLGLMWPARFVEEIVVNGARDELGSINFAEASNSSGAMAG
jgi:hypothetical protein